MTPAQATPPPRGDRATGPPHRTGHRNQDRDARTAPGCAAPTTGSARTVAPHSARRRAGGRRGPWRLLRRARIGRVGEMRMPRMTQPNEAIKTLTGQIAVRSRGTGTEARCRTIAATASGLATRFPRHRSVRVPGGRASANLRERVGSEGRRAQIPNMPGMICFSIRSVKIKIPIEKFFLTETGTPSPNPSIVSRRRRSRSRSHLSAMG